MKKYIYQYKDHLGNVRLSYADTDNNGTIDAATEIIEESNYYPFGLKHKGYNNVVSSNGNSVAQKFKYNGVEYNESLGLNLYEMDVRMYDPAIGRFNGIDPVVHHSQGTSVAFDNNPVFWADPSGADAIIGGDGLTNEQWMNSSGPNGSFEDMTAQANSNKGKTKLEIIGDVFNDTEKGGRSYYNFETGEASFLSKEINEKVLGLFKRLVGAMNEHIKKHMYNRALSEVVPFETYERDKLKNIMETDISDIQSDIKKLLGPLQTKWGVAFWGSVTLDKDQEVTSASYERLGDVNVFYNPSRSSVRFIRKKSFGDLGSDPKKRNVWHIRKENFWTANKYGYNFISMHIAWKTYAARQVYINYFNNVKAQYKETFRKKYKK